MKKIFVLGLIAALAISPAVRACDICGCGVGNFNPHMFPHLAKSFLSFGYNYRYFKTHLHDGTGEENTEYYHTFQIAGQFSPIKKMQVIAALPFQMNRQDGVHGFKSLNHLGDAVVLSNYRFIDAFTGKQNQVRHTFLAGVGVKLPTGKSSYNHDNESQVHNANFQAGSGSTDFMFNSSYNLRVKQWVMSAGATYKINGSNSESYRFGDRLLGLAQAKYIKDFGRFSLIPNAGLTFEKLEMDKSHGISVDHTGGYTFQATTGMDINNRNWAVGFVYQRPIVQDLAAGHIHAMPGFNLHLSYSF